MVYFLNFFALLSLDVQRFAYCGIMQDHEGIYWSSTIFEAIFSASRLTSVRSWTLLMWITWLICPVSLVPSQIKGMGDLSVTCIDAGYSFMSLVKSWELGPGGGSWEPGSCGSCFQAFLGKGMLADSLVWHYFGRLKFSYVEIYEWYCTKFSKLARLFPPSCDP